MVRRLGSAFASEQRKCADAHPAPLGLATKAIHAGFRLRPATGAVNAPILRATGSTFAQDGVWHCSGGFRVRGPVTDRAVLEASKSAVEDGSYGGVQFR